MRDVLSISSAKNTSMTSVVYMKELACNDEIGVLILQPCPCLQLATVLHGSIMATGYRPTGTLQNAVYFYVICGAL